ncbi:Putative HTH-type transcriptional regulator [Streptomyces sp. YIM 121038]|uniref:AfsR/SARP family transcriptional regulator n=1 Tax=Streptomyces sp. YIM 121038 TaxID=2136401 RepID=UPI001162BF5F|nr:BTAD domain-containing putative transcriptional regulator [Streptomyces sp. YIM 121038]QCX78686.1 Putative HTH-type transcriptional regulator [Streptomyces sp. YIM 121038]
MRFEVLGPLAVRTDDGTLIPVPEPKVRALLAALLARTGHPVPADTLVEDLWGAGKLPANPANSLQTKVSQLRRAIGRDTVAYGPAGYRLSLAGGATDAARFESLTARAYSTDTGPRGRAALLTDALALWRGPAYADFRDADFARAAAARLEEQRLTAQETLAEARLALGEHALLADDLADPVAREPLRERLRAAHMRALYRAGRPSEALAAYQDLRTRLADDLGTDPGPELAALYGAILRQDPALASPPTAPAPAPTPPAAPAPVVAPPRTNLPAPTTHLVGRADAVDRVRQLVRRDRLVTLTGPGGVGKTRLALEAAADLVDDFPDGVWLVELAGTTGDGVLEAVAAALGVREDNAARRAFEGEPEGPDAASLSKADARASAASAPGSHAGSASGAAAHAGTGSGPGPGAGPAPGNPRLAHLTRALAARHALLILDNCEHVLDAAADLVAHLLRHAPHLRTLTTSQEPLALTGETLEAVAPLGEDEAVRLFAERAAATAPGFVLDDGNRAAVALICRRLDGIPLAVELAATRVRALGVHALADRLHDRFRLLNQVRRDAPARQRTLRAMIDWSWDLLSAPERRALRQLAVFRGGFTLESAEAVLTGTGARPGPEPRAAAALEAAPEPQTWGGLTAWGGPEAGGALGAGGDPEVGGGFVLDLVARLLDRSLLATAGPGPDAGGPVRHRLLESVAAYSLERLAEAGESKDLALRHAHHYADLAERAAPALHGPDQRHWLRRLDAETVNLRAALDRAAAEADTALALRLVNALTWYWYLRGRLTEAIRSLAVALSLPAGPGAARASAAAARGAFSLLAGEDACAHGSSCAHGTDGADARSRWLLALARCGFDRTPEEGRRVDALLTEFRTAGDRWGEAAALSTRATRALYAGDLAVLRRDATRAADLFARLGDRWGQLQSSEQLGVLAEITADYDEAARLQHEGARGAEELELWTEVSFRLSRLGRLALLTGDDARATAHHERAARLAARQSHRPAQQFAETGLALGARRRGDLDTAERLLLPWLDFNRRFGISSGAALILAQLGYAAEQRGDAARAEHLHREGLDAARATGDNRAVALALEGLAGARSLAGAHPEAAGLLGRAAALRAAEGTPLPEAERADVDRATARGRTALGTEAFDSALRTAFRTACDSARDPAPDSAADAARARGAAEPPPVACG